MIIIITASTKAEQPTIQQCQHTNVISTYSEVAVNSMYTQSVAETHILNYRLRTYD